MHGALHRWLGQVCPSEHGGRARDMVPIPTTTEAQATWRPVGMFLVTCLNDAQKHCVTCLVQKLPRAEHRCCCRAPYSYCLQIMEQDFVKSFAGHFAHAAVDCFGCPATSVALPCSRCHRQLSAAESADVSHESVHQIVCSRCAPPRGRSQQKQHGSSSSLSAGRKAFSTFDGVVRALNLEDARSRLEVEAVFLTLGEAGEISYSAFNAAAMLSSADNSADVEDLSVFGQFETCEAVHLHEASSHGSSQTDNKANSQVGGSHGQNERPKRNGMWMSNVQRRTHSLSVHHLRSTSLWGR